VVKTIVAGIFVTAMIAAVVIGIMQLVAPTAEAQGRGSGGWGQGGAGRTSATDAGAQGNGRGYAAQAEQTRAEQTRAEQTRVERTRVEQVQAGQVRGGQDQGQRGQGQDGGLNGTCEPQAELEEWVTVEGTVLQTLELVVETEDGETVQVGLGPSHYRDAQGFVLGVGDQVRISGYWEDGEFKAGQVENLTNGDTITLRDAYGRPMWSGQGRGNS
jgi:hypothetical protein